MMILFPWIQAENMLRVIADFAYDRSLGDEMKRRYVEAACAETLRGVMLGEYGEAWRSHLPTLRSQEFGLICGV